MLVAQSCPTLCDPMDCSLPGSSVHGIFQGRILEWVDIPFSGGTSQHRDRTWVSHIDVRFFTIWATREAWKPPYGKLNTEGTSSQHCSHPTCFCLRAQFSNMPASLSPHWSIRDSGFQHPEVCSGQRRETTWAPLREEPRSHKVTHIP